MDMQTIDAIFGKHDGLLCQSLMSLETRTDTSESSNSVLSIQTTMVSSDISARSLKQGVNAICELPRNLT